MSTAARISAVLAGAIVLLAGPTLAAAQYWYYEWSCTGRCAPGELVRKGREGPFPTEEACNWARDNDGRATEFVSEGNLGGLSSCFEIKPSGSGGGGVVVGEGAPPPNKVRMVALELGVLVGPAWAATGEDGMTRRGTGTIGLELDSHSGRDLGGGAIQLGLHATSLDAPLLGGERRTLMTVPFSVGIVLSPRLAGGRDWTVRGDLGASLGGLWLASCSGCAGAVFSETLIFGYTLKAGADIYTSRNGGFSVDVILPRWRAGAAGPGNLLLESPTWMLRLSMLVKPPPEP